jgi:hypothetical protein
LIDVEGATVRVSTFNEGKEEMNMRAMRKRESKEEEKVGEKYKGKAETKK